MASKTQTKNRGPQRNAPVEEDSDAKSASDKIKDTYQSARDAYRKADDASRPYRVGLAPVVAVGGLWGAGEALDAFVQHAPHGGLAAVGAGVLGLVALRAERSEKVLGWMNVETPNQAVWTRVTTAAASGWLSLIGLFGSGAAMHEALLVTGVVLSAPVWWKFHKPTGERELPAPPPPVFEEPEPEEVPEIEAPADYIWDSKIACTNGALAGAYLDDGGWEETEYGRTAAFWLPDSGNILVPVAIGRTAQLTQIYRRRLGDLVIERHADCVEGHMQITILDRTAAEETRIWEGPNFDPDTIWDGIIELGPYTDGRGMASIRIFKPGYGAYHTLVCGGTGAGKTSVVSMIIAKAEHSGMCQTWVYEPEDNRSLTAWTANGRIRRVAFTYEDAYRMLKAAQAVMHENIKYTSTIKWEDEDGYEWTGKDCFEPTPERKMLVVVLDEAHVPLAEKAFAKLVSDIAKRGRKGGVALVIVTQTPTQQELGGVEGGPIRTNVRMGNSIVLRTTSRMDSPMLKLPFDPSDLPDKFPAKDGGEPQGTHGIGFILSPSAVRNNVIFRAMWDKHATRWVKTSPMPQLHPDAERAAQLVFDNPDLVIGGDGASMLTLPTLPPPPMTRDNEDDEQKVALKREMFYAYLAENGPTQRGEIFKACGISPAHGARICRDGMRKGELTNDGTGVYGLAPEEALE